MRHLDMQTWSRRDHFEKFNAFDHPHFGLCANVDLTAFLPYVKQQGDSVNVAIVYVLARAANAIPEFRHRIRAEKVIEHQVVHPSFTVLTDEDLFSFCTVEYAEDYREFAERTTEQMANVQEQPTLKDEPGQDDLLFMTAIPWVSFTSFLHPMHLQPPDSVPRISWGKFFEEDPHLKMPLGVQAHHALMDGIYVGKYYAEVQDYLQNPAVVLGNQ